MKEKLQKLFGPGSVSDIESDRLIYSTDASCIKGKVQFVVWPKDEEQIRRILTLANRQAAPVTIRGAGTSLVAGAVPNNSVVLNTTKMKKILRLNLKEGSLEVEAGANIHHINNVLKRFNLFFPIVPFSSKVCTIGGMIATNAGCPASYSLGNILDWVIEFRYMDGTGKLFRISNKNKMMDLVGSEGTLCIFTHIKLRLAKRKPSYTEVLTSKTTTHLINTLGNVIKTPSIVSVEFIDPLVSLMSGLEESYHLFVTYFCKDKGTHVSTGETAVRPSNKTSDKTKNARANAHHITNRRHYTVLEDVQVPLQNLREFLRWLRTKSIPCFGHIATGRLHLKFKKDQQFLIEGMYSKLASLNGKAYGELGIGRLKAPFVAETSKEKFHLLKQKHDPNNILNRGVCCVS